MALVVVVLTSSAAARNIVWDTKLSLWTDIVRKTPGKSRVHNSLGNCYMLLGRHHEAIAEYKIALALDANNIEVYFNLGMNLEEIGLGLEAAGYYRHFCQAAPADYPDAIRIACERAVRLGGNER